MNFISQKLHLNRARCKKILRGLVFCTIGFSLALVIDLLLARTNYSLAILYQTASKVICLRSTDLSCESPSVIATPPTARFGATGMVVSEQREATQAGIDILNQGSNAIDDESNNSVKGKSTCFSDWKFRRPHNSHHCPASDFESRGESAAATVG